MYLNNDLATDSNCSISCPLCRTSNMSKAIESISAVKGLSETCQICLDKNATVLFPSCGHLVSCNQCYNTIKKISKESF